MSIFKVLVNSPAGSMMLPVEFEQAGAERYVLFLNAYLDEYFGFHATMVCLGSALWQDDRNVLLRQFGIKDALLLY